MPEQTQAATTPSAAPVQTPETKAPATQPVVSTTPPAPIDKASAPSTATDSESSLLDSAKAEGEEAKAEGEGKKADAPAPGAPAPDKYDLKAPEGVTLDPADVESFTPLAKELGLTNEGAQKLVNYEAERMKKFHEAQETNFKRYVSDMKTETLKHYEDQQKAGGPTMKEAMVFVAKARSMFVSPELQNEWNQTGQANSKNTILFLEKVGRLISEDKMIEGERRAGREATAQDLYPSMKQN